MNESIRGTRKSHKFRERIVYKTPQSDTDTNARPGPFAYSLVDQAESGLVDHILLCVTNVSSMATKITDPVICLTPK